MTAPCKWCDPPCEHANGDHDSMMVCCLCDPGVELRAALAAAVAWVDAPVALRPPGPPDWYVAAKELLR